MEFISSYAITIMLGLQLAIILFHVFILVKIIPYKITWGGRLKNDSQMYAFEIISILINLFLSLVLLIKANMVRDIFSSKTVDIILWVFLILFILNTIGNIFAKTLLEKYFTFLTIIAAALIFQILR